MDRSWTEDLAGSWRRLAPLPNPTGVAGAFVGVVDNCLVVAGGANFPNKPPWENGTKVWHTDIWLLDKPDGKWIRAGELPAPRGYGAAWSVGGTLVCAGGSDSTTHHAKVWQLRRNRTGTIDCSEIRPLPGPVANAAWASDSRSLLIAGGQHSPMSTTAQSNALLLTRAGEKHEPLPDIPGNGRILGWAARSGSEWLVGGGAALVAGADGKPIRRLHRDSWKISDRSRQWEPLPDTPLPVVAPPNPCLAHRGTVAVLPADDGSRAGFTPPDAHPGFPRRALGYDTRSRVWTAVAGFPFSVVTTGAVAWRGLWVVASGEIRPGVRTPEIWARPLPR
jgi:N-acetylneuraminate epimerase